MCMSTIQNIRQELVKDPAVKVKPETVDITMLPVVRSMLESNIHPDVTLDDLKLVSCMEDDMKKKLFRVVSQGIRKWSSDVVEELESVARERLNLTPLLKPTHLPPAIFCCKRCTHRLVFDEALSHRHLYKERRHGKRNTSDMSIHERLLTEYEWKLPRDIDILRIDVRASRRVENLIRRMGKNPNTVTYGELYRSTVKVACSLCRSPTNMDFETASEHCISAHPCNETEIWTRISARKTAETPIDK